jgi:hypothetical protein
MTAEILAATEHLVLRRKTNDDAAALAAYRSDPVQAHYQSSMGGGDISCHLGRRACGDGTTSSRK